MIAPVIFRTCSVERWMDMLGVLPPACQTGLGFLYGEPEGFRQCSVSGAERPAYTAYVETPAMCLESLRSMTQPEFALLRPGHVVVLRTKQYEHLWSWELDRAGVSQVSAYGYGSAAEARAAGERYSRYAMGGEATSLVGAPPTAVKATRTPTR